MTAGVSSSSFLFFSDVHFDPFADPKLVKSLAATDVSGWNDIFASSAKKDLSAYGSDTNYPLLESALDSMAATAAGVDLIVFPGDALAHNFEKNYATLTGDSSSAGLESFVQKTVTFFAGEVDRRFPNAMVLVAVGNNDSVLGDYKSSPGDPYLSLTAGVLGQDFFNNDKDRAAFTLGYANGGYYAVEPNGPAGLKYIVLNDIFGSPRSEASAAGQAELAWFFTELVESSLRNQKVWVVGHIPLGADAKSMAADIETKGYDYKGLLTDSFNNAYAALEIAFAPTIQATLAGHTHRDDFRLLSAEPFAMPAELLSISNSISPVDSNNPGYEIVSYDTATGSLLDRISYSLDLSKPAAPWTKEYDYAATYGQGLATPEEWRNVAADILVNPASRAAYAKYYTAGSTLAAATPVTDANFPVYWLSDTNLTHASFAVAAALLTGS
jgi:sphingomyelin phosphodiesterase acid-like 3